MENNIHPSRLPRSIALGCGVLGEFFLPPSHAAMGNGVCFHILSFLFKCPVLVNAHADLTLQLRSEMLKSSPKSTDYIRQYIISSSAL